MIGSSQHYFSSLPLQHIQVIRKWGLVLEHLHCHLHSQLNLGLRLKFQIAILTCATSMTKIIFCQMIGLNLTLNLTHWLVFCHILPILLLNLSLQRHSKGPLQQLLFIKILCA